MKFNISYVVLCLVKHIIHTCDMCWNTEAWLLPGRRALIWCGLYAYRERACLISRGYRRGDQEGLCRLYTCHLYNVHTGSRRSALGCLNSSFKLLFQLLFCNCCLFTWCDIVEKRESQISLLSREICETLSFCLIPLERMRATLFFSRLPSVF